MYVGKPYDTTNNIAFGILDILGARFRPQPYSRVEKDGIQRKESGYIVREPAGSGKFRASAHATDAGACGDRRPLGGVGDRDFPPRPPAAENLGRPGVVGCSPRRYISRRLRSRGTGESWQGLRQDPIANAELSTRKSGAQKLEPVGSSASRVRAAEG